MTQCPKCNGTLVLDYSGGIPVAQCETCRGLWLSATALFAQVAGASARVANSLHTALAPERGAPLAEGSCCCPACLAPMRVHVIGDVEVEYCHRCAGVYLDASELIHLMARLRPTTGRHDDEPVEGEPGHSATSPAAVLAALLDIFFFLS